MFQRFVIALVGIALGAAFAMAVHAIMTGNRDGALLMLCFVALDAFYLGRMV